MQKLKYKVKKENAKTQVSGVSQYAELCSVGDSGVPGTGPP